MEERIRKIQKGKIADRSLSTDESFLLQSRVLRTPRELRMIDALLTRVVVVHPTASMQHFASMICRLNANPTTGRGELLCRGAKPLLYQLVLRKKRDLKVNDLYNRTVQF